MYLCRRALSEDYIHTLAILMVKKEWIELCCGAFGNHYVGVIVNSVVMDEWK